MSLQHHLMVRISWLLLVDTTGSTIMRYLIKSYIRFSTTTLVSFGVIDKWIAEALDHVFYRILNMLISSKSNSFSHINYYSRGKEGK